MMTKDEGGRLKPVMHEQSLMMFSTSWDTSAFLEMEGGKDMIMPGEDAAITLKMKKCMVLQPNQHFTLRDGASTVGTGKVRFRAD